MYRPTQRSQEGTQLACLSLAKFSYTTTSISHRGPFNWSHIIGNGDVICIFERHAMPAPLYSKTLLKVIRDHDILEHIDITHLLREAMGQPQSSQHGQTKPIFAVVVKLPCLAVKYPEGNGYIRRFQIKFSLERDFYSALSILSDIKCPFSESSPGSISVTRRLTTSQWPMPPAPYPAGSFSNLSSLNGIPALRIPPSPLYSGAVSLPVMTPDPTPGTPNPSSYTAFTCQSAPNVSQRHNSIIATASMRQSLLHTPSDGTSTEAASIPSTATVCHDFQALNQLLPPKRDLPFPKQPAKKQCSTLLPQPSTISRTEDAYKAIPNTATQPTLSPPVLPLKQRATEKMQNSRVTTLKYRPSSQSQPSQKNLTHSQASHRHNLTQPTITPHILPETTQQDTPLLNQRPTTDNSRQEPQYYLSTKADLSVYMASPTADRTRKLDNWICSNIEDDGFLQLCEDVEGIWRRFAFGK